MGVVSALQYTLLDEAGNPRTEGWFVLDFTANYPQGGQAFDLSPYFRQIEHILTQPISGSELRAVLSGATPASGAFWNSGEAVLIRPVPQDFNTPASSRFQIWANPIALSGFGNREIVSAPATVVSGLRFLARALGY